MPYQWVPAALFLEHQAVAIYRTYRHDVDTEMRTYHFVRDEWEGEDGDTAFDVRELSTWEPVAAPPTLCGANDTPANRAAWEAYHASEPERIRQAIIRAIEGGELMAPAPDDHA